MLVKTTRMDVQPPPTVSYTLYDNEPDKTIGGCVRTGCKESDSRVIKVRGHSRLAIPPHHVSQPPLSWGASLDYENQTSPYYWAAGLRGLCILRPAPEKEAERRAHKYPA